MLNITNKSGRVAIPQPQIFIQKRSLAQNDEVYAHWLPNQSEAVRRTIKNFISDGKIVRYYLFRFKKNGARIEDGVHICDTGQKWVHPSHQNGVNFVGRTMYNGQNFNTQGQLIQGRNTEFNIDTNPYKKTRIDLIPEMWFNERGTNFTGPIVLPLNHNLVYATSNQSSYKSKIQIFKIAIGITDENQSSNTNEPRSEVPVYFGPFSDQFVVYPFRNNGGTVVEAFKMRLGSESRSSMSFG